MTIDRERLKTDPAYFAECFLGVELSPQQKKVMRKILDGWTFKITRAGIKLVPPTFEELTKEEDEG